MRKISISIGAMLLALTTTVQAQFSAKDVNYFVGTGADTAYLVVDFIDTLTVAGGFDTLSSSYAWGYLFDASNVVTAGEMMNAVAVDDINLSVTTGGGFLSDIVYDNHSGYGGNPNYWGTWSTTDTGSWAMNGGLTDTLFNGLWFGCSYTDFNPAVEPSEPKPAINPNLFTLNDVEYWLGSGTDTAVLNIDFLDGNMVSSFAWGVLFNDSISGEEMLTLLNTEDENATIVIGGGFISDIYYGFHKGLGGNPNYWGTWSGSNFGVIHSNSGVSTIIKNGEWFSCSYTDFAPAKMPQVPAPAFDANLFSVQDINFWTGNGTDTAVFVVDFQENGITSSYAWGVLFNDSTTGADLLSTVEAIDTNLSSTLSGGFLMDMNYNSHNGIGGSPNYWGTWSATNTGDWIGNFGLTTKVENGDWFGCSYTDFNPAIRPNAPVSATVVVPAAIQEMEDARFNLFPNPTNGDLHLTMLDFEQGETASVSIINVAGQTIQEFIIQHPRFNFSINQPAGVYFLKVVQNNTTNVVKVTKQ